MIHLQRQLCLPLTTIVCLAQTAYLQPAPRTQLPTQIDGNSPAFWTPEGLRLFSSTGNPEMISEASSQFGPWQSQAVDVTQQVHVPFWIEAAWRDDDGTLFGWYHHEPAGVCASNNLTAPKIGAVISYDGGMTVKDLGIVLESGDQPDCNAKNGFFAGGHGDFSVVPDRERGYFYFFFTNYGGAAAEQGIVTARIAFEDRFQPAGSVRKYYRGEWSEPGVGGRVTPIFPVAKAWQRDDTDSYWGPSVHWNTHLEQFVILLNRSCCKPGWPQEGIYVTFNADLDNPSTWLKPDRILQGSKIGYQPGFYPQVLGMQEPETDSLAGEVARLYVHGISNWEIVFSKEARIISGPDGPDRPTDLP